MCILQINIQITNFYRYHVSDNSQLINGGEKAELLNKKERTLKQKQVERKSNEIVTCASIQ